MRKTIPVEQLKTQVNDMLKDSYDKEDRSLIILMLENVLHSTDNYDGFAYLNRRDMRRSEHGTTVGIGDQNPDGTFSFENTDRTRVRYF